MRVLLTGANGFLGKNLLLHLSQRKDVQVVCFTREDDVAQLPTRLLGVDLVFHLAGVNRPDDPQEFNTGNVELTRSLCQAMAAMADTNGKKVSVVYTSSAQAGRDTPYGQSKLRAEEALMAVAHSHQLAVHIFRLPNVFGKWCKPNYNSAVATFCHNTARGLPIQIHDPQATLDLVYVDDVIERFIQLMDSVDAVAGPDGFATVTPRYCITVGELARQIQAFRDSRATLVTERVGTGLVRALYCTYVSYLPVESFAYALPQHEDPRGVFMEMLKTPDCGQFSFFTAHPGMTRGGHYHHSKTEKFLVIKGQARFRFKHMQTGAAHELVTTGEQPQIVETVPGWTHDMTNIGSEQVLVLLWANEMFDRSKPDTFSCPL